MPVEILSLAAAAERLGVSTHEVVVMVHDRQIEYVLVDGVARISEAIVNALLEERRPAS